ncbi:hypothetical protein predicted by Glimmer/Critica [Sorangium cellulosum So ce56]|uniref:DUF2169 domain-containing protein n=1 Tax=Sorangium cellulosum (strain So ce56) TaxID=448385 RepID=A9FHC5_SORC5|nr:DUF2169 domain-containing protein [Sorangium cellulosum]CAN98202.1 hypothetical protein predicted by Glimmer/Critica [Sorangium cellulosum So ce56]
MSIERTPAREAYDAVLELGPWEGVRPTAYVLVKKTFTIAGRRCMPAPPRPLLNDPRDERLAPRLPARVEFWPSKAATDFVVRGAAYAPSGRPAAQMLVEAAIGATSKRIAVFGRREIRWTAAGRPVIDDPEPFTVMPVIWELAYGGTDTRVELRGEVSLSQIALASMGADHPGTYPRNPLGKGYLVDPAPLHGAEMPNLEDPLDRLTPERLVTGDPALWYRQPLPACFDFVPPLAFPRHLGFGPSVEPWFPAPDDERLPEVRLGVLPAGYRAAREPGVSRRLFQEAPQGFVLDAVRGDEVVRVDGMHAERPSVEFTLPGSPSIEFTLEGRRVPAAPRTHTIVVEPAVERVSIVYGATVDLPRTFIPGIHKYIPIAVTIDGDRPIEYQPPPTHRARTPATVGRGGRP